MKRKSNCMRFVATMLCCVVLAGVFTGCKNTNADGNPTPNILGSLNMDVEATRANYEKLTKELEEMYQQNPDDTAISLAYAEKLLQLGDLTNAQKILSLILSCDTPEPQAIYLAACIAYLEGDYRQSESLYNTLFHEFSEYRGKAVFGLEYVYYQTNQYKKAQDLPEEYASKTGFGAMMRGFGSREPYKVSWSGKEEATIPFVVTEPLPIIQVDINEERRYFLIDTGAGDTYLDETVAKDLGLETIAKNLEEYAGGIAVETRCGILDSMKLGGATLESIPVYITDLAPISSEFDFKLSGVLGTGVFKQFRATMNYLDESLILTPRGEQKQIKSVISEVPFMLTGTHFMLCKAAINNKNINVFTDSGLAAPETSLVLSKNAMDYAEISTPNMEENDSGGGLGGGDFDVGYFTADTYQMGTLPTVNDIKGMAGVFPENYYFKKEYGLFIDGIISHNYLKDYIWTIDFDAMTMTFSK